MKSFQRYFCLFIFAFLLVNCAKKQLEPMVTPSGIVLPFEIIQKSDIPGGEPGLSPQNFPVYYSGETTVFVLMKQEDIKEVERYISTSTKEKLYSLDFNQIFVVVIFQGDKPTTGFGVEVHEIRNKNHQIDIFATLTEPPSDVPVGQAITSPFEVITLQKDDLQGKYIFSLISSGKNILQKEEVFP